MQINQRCGSYRQAVSCARKGNFAVFCKPRSVPKRLRRDDWRCQSCAAMSNLEVHHREFRSHSAPTPRKPCACALACSNAFVNLPRFCFSRALCNQVAQSKCCLSSSSLSPRSDPKGNPMFVHSECTNSGLRPPGGPSRKQRVHIDPVPVCILLGLCPWSMSFAFCSLTVKLFLSLFLLSLSGRIAGFVGPQEAVSHTAPVNVGSRDSVTWVVCLWGWCPGRSQCPRPKR
jgi:hypothetical protein